MVTLAQRQDVLEALEAGRIDAALVAIDRLDGGWLARPGTQIVRTGCVHSLRINIGFLARAEAHDLLVAPDRVIDRARTTGELSDGTRWPAAPGSLPSTRR